MTKKIQSFPLLPRLGERPTAGSAPYVSIELEDGEAPPPVLEGFTADGDIWHPERRVFDGGAYVPAE